MENHVNGKTLSKIISFCFKMIKKMCCTLASLPTRIETVTKLQEQHIAFQSITENINTKTSTGQLVFHIFGALAEFERNLIRERTIAGLEAARARGRFGGRPELTGASSKVAMAKKLYADKTTAINDICKTLHISRATLYRYIKAK
jgi:DNA invertase Pin-like site-specific DNA recombinase